MLILSELPLVPAQADTLQRGATPLHCCGCPACPGLPRLQAHHELKNYDAAIRDYEKVAQMEEGYPGALPSTAPCPRLCPCPRCEMNADWRADLVVCV